MTTDHRPRTTGQGQRILFFCFFLFFLLFSALSAMAEERKSLFLKVKESQGDAQAMAEERYPIRSFKIKYYDAETMSDAIKNILAQGEGVSVSKKLNAIIVRGAEGYLARVGQVIKQLDQAPAQIQVEAKLIEIKNSNGDSASPMALGASWKIKNKSDANDFVQSLTAASLTAGATAAGLYAQIISGNVEGYLNAIQKSTNYNLLASPWITALNHVEASITIGESILYAAETTTNAAGQTIQSNLFKDIGTILTFTPHINEDGYILMYINPLISTGTPTTGINKTETKNWVLVKDGQSIVIGGLTRKYNTELEVGVPILSKLPFLGTLFRRTELISEKRDLMIIITPRILTPGLINKLADKANVWQESSEAKPKEFLDTIR